MRTILADYLWGSKARLSYLLIGSAILLCTALGARELWTQEWRWADICWNMIYSSDYLHPYLAGEPYYDKPLLSYWLMIVFSHILGGLTEWALRLPSALAGILTVYCTYRLGLQLANQRVGFIAGWMLTTSYYFIFWARTANADLLNLAGIMLALVWYFSKREQPSFFNYAVFFIILAITSLFKGLIGIIIPLLAILPDLLKDNAWKKHLQLSLVPALVPALIIYFLPFWASVHFGGQHYNESGLFQVYRENILRYFEPFDHKDPVYTYFVFLPIYMLPWAFFFIPALFALRKDWQNLNQHSRWFAWSTLIIFIFFTCSGSRRNYYTLPLVPFAMLFTADWIARGIAVAKRNSYAAKTLIMSFILFFVAFGVSQFFYYYDGLRTFNQQIQTQATKIKPWNQWQIVLLDARSKLSFYLQPTKPVIQLSLPNNEQSRHSFSANDLIKQWPVLLEHRSDTILVTRLLYLEKLKPYLNNYQIIIATPSLGDRLLHKDDDERPVALLPRL